MSVINKVKEESSVRLLFIQGMICDATAEEICSTILHLNYIDAMRDKSAKDYTPQPIHIYINSPGGTMNEMWAIINCIIASKTPVYTYCTGVAQSAASSILMAGHKRFIYKYGEVMIHQMSMSGKTSLTTHNWNVKGEVINNWQKNVNNYIMEKTSITEEILNDMIEGNRDLFYNAEDALKYKIVDEII